MCDKSTKLRLKRAFTGVRVVGGRRRNCCFVHGLRRWSADAQCVTLLLITGEAPGLTPGGLSGDEHRADGEADRQQNFVVGRSHCAKAAIH